MKVLKIFTIISMVAFMGYGQATLTQEYTFQVDSIASGSLNLTWVSRHGQQLALDSALCLVDQSHDSLLSRQPCKIWDLRTRSVNDTLDDGYIMYDIREANIKFLDGASKIGTAGQNKVKISFWGVNVDDHTEIMVYTLKYKIYNNRIRLTQIIEGTFTPSVPALYQD